MAMAVTVNTTVIFCRLCHIISILLSSSFPPQVYSNADEDDDEGANSKDDEKHVDILFNVVQLSFLD